MDAKVQPLLWKSAGGAVACDPYFNNCVLLMGFEGANGSTGAPGWTDQSPSAHGTASTSANAQIDTSQLKFGASSGHWNATPTPKGAASFGSSNDWNFGSGKFTIETWVRFNSGTADRILVGLLAGGPVVSWYLWINSVGTLTWTVSTDGSTLINDITYTWTPSNGVWYFVTVDYDGAKYRLYVNGAMVGSSTTARNIYNGTLASLNLGIGANSTATIDFLDGWLDELRITKGIARYASDAGFAVPTAAFPRVACPACDPYFNNTVLLMGYEGANGSTGAPGMTDQSPAAHGTGTVHGSAQISTSQFKFDSSSIQIGSAIQSDYVQFPDSSDWILSSANSDQFTIECWVRLNTLTNNGEIVGQTGNIGSRAWALYSLNTGELQFLLSSDGNSNNVNLVTSGAGITTGAWYHVAVDKDATGKIRIYNNGAMKASSTPANSAIFNSTLTLYIGTAGAVTGDHGIDGWLDETRITKGVARYATDTSFEVPTAAFPRTQCSGAVTTWNPSDKEATLTLSGGNLVASIGSVTGGVRATVPKSIGKLYFEVTPTGGSGQSTVGICTSAANMANLYSSNWVGGAGLIIGNGFVYSNGSSTGKQIEGGSIAFPSTICVAIDFPNSLMWVRATGATNNGFWNGSSSNDPATGIGGASISALFPSNLAFPVVSMFGASGEVRTVNFGASAFVGTVPSGFTAWG